MCRKVGPIAVSIDTIPLPSHAHVPGSNQRHAEDFLDPVKDLACPQTLDTNAADNPAWLYGLRLIDLGYYWEAHEILETVWMRTPPNSRERHLVQGIIHLANAALKVKMLRPKAAERLRGLARMQIDEAFMGHGDRNLMLLRQKDLISSISDGGEPSILTPN